MSKLHIERVYAWGDNEHHYIDVPEDFKMYEVYKVNDKQRFYLWFGEIDDTLGSGFSKVIGTSVYKIDGKMLIVSYNNDIGNYIHTIEHVSNNVQELYDMLLPWLKQYVVVQYKKYEVNMSTYKTYVEKISSATTSEERDALMQSVNELLHGKDILCTVSKVLAFDEGYITTANLAVNDLLGRPCTALNVARTSFDKFMMDISFDKSYTYSIYSKMTNDMSIFENAYANFRKTIEV